MAIPQITDWMWSGAGSNRRPSAFQVNRAKRYADLRKRTSPTSETALGGRCTLYASRVSTRPYLSDRISGIDALGGPGTAASRDRNKRRHVGRGSVCPSAHHDSNVAYPHPKTGPPNQFSTGLSDSLVHVGPSMIFGFVVSAKMSARLLTSRRWLYRRDDPDATML